MRCEGYRKNGNFLTLGAPKWVQCENDAKYMLRINDGEIKDTLPACSKCKDECDHYEEATAI